MNFFKIFVFLTAQCVVASAMAADLSTFQHYGGGQCLSSSHSNIMSLPEEEIVRVVEEYHDLASMELESATVIYSRSPAFEWAGEAKIACETALGYFDGNHVDTQSIQKCDCFTRRMTSYR